jgi:hypothetical protein
MAAREQDGVVEVAEMFGEVARVLAADDDEHTTLDRIVHLAVENLESCEYAGISLVEGRDITSPASSNEIPKVVDRLQSESARAPASMPSPRRTSSGPAT